MQLSLSIGEVAYNLCLASKDNCYCLCQQRNDSDEDDSDDEHAVQKNAGLKFQPRWIMDPLLSGTNGIG